MEPLKEMFNNAFYARLATEFSKVHKDFHTGGFVKDVLSGSQTLSLNQRMRNTSVVLKKYLPDNYERSIGIMMEVIPNLNPGYTTLVFPDFVGLFGLNDFSTSMKALKFFTRFGSSEFAIREFLKQDFDRTLRVMYGWSTDENAHVRRLSSEGSRPRLPWSFKLEAMIANPSLSKPILENLKSDDALYVRKSVANHLNDISKDSPEHVYTLIKAWDRTNPHTAWIIKHGCRSLLKIGDSKFLTLFGIDQKANVTLKKLKLNKRSTRLNESLDFSFDLTSHASRPQKIILYYRIHYVKKSGSCSPKTFKLRELKLDAMATVKISKRQRFQDFTTRTHFSGKHTLDILANGKVIGSKAFQFKR